jgi:hypothetical protein
LKKINDGIHFAFLVHMRNGPCSHKKNAIKCCNSLMNQSQHIDKVIDQQTFKENLKNRLRLKTSIDSTRNLTAQGCALKVMMKVLIQKIVAILLSL